MVERACLFIGATLRVLGLVVVVPERRARGSARHSRLTRGCSGPSFAKAVGAAGPSAVRRRKAAARHMKTVADGRSLTNQEANRCPYAAPQRAAT
jgi:hypothetical protein